ncbi:sterol desaturase family protein [Photobacterium sanctipauli]|uniref:Sterol desaturase family protein n=1 Tax=Photobacterium sanctipauli TaxID=1342794 RepID=A0A2T3NNX0_9GAMM|nr:sterol desaturase family protein [Photobacterium sanctipauli]PSW17667.1 sterol desaturase family protein [Photobacterium sanctipauli]
MDWLTFPWSDTDVYSLEVWVQDWSFVLFLGIFGLELIRLSFKKLISWRILGDAVTNFITLYLFIGINFILAATFYIAIFYVVYEHFSIIQLPTNLWTIVGCLVLADLAYYWEHRFVHRVKFAWATHTVHHSSPYFNISVAFRFGPLDGFFPLFFHLPLAILGFNPLVIFLCEAIVQIYQTVLHTEAVKKLPRPIEAVFNTPSHHRVHHGVNRQYLDKNYAGILIIWDKMFGTFAEEKDKVRFGVYPQINTINPIKVFFGGYWDLCKQCFQCSNWRDRINTLIKPPGWEPADNKLKEK